ncbi:MAG: hypothetical protein WBA57_22680 [Elainellaceae cyanobacterium]
MPHIIVEYSDNLSRINIPLLLSELHDELAAQDTVTKSAIKSRAIAIPEENVILGDEDDYDELLHITIKLLPGRNDDLKKNMARALYSVACGAVRAEYDNCSVTVEVMELHAESYTK